MFSDFSLFFGLFFCFDVGFQTMNRKPASDFNDFHFNSNFTANFSHFCGFATVWRVDRSFKYFSLFQVYFK